MRALLAKGRRLHRRGQGDAARRRARDPAAGDSRVCGGRRTRTGRAVDLALLPSDPAAAVRHGHLPPHAPALPDAARAVPASRRRGRAARTRRRRCTSGCSAAGPSGSGRPKARCRTRWCRWSPTRDSGGWRPTRRSWPGRAASRSLAAPRATSISPRRCTARTGSDAPARRSPAGSATTRLSDLIGFSYASWSADGAADDFVQRLVASRPPLRVAHRRGRGDHLRHPRRRERLGALRRAGPPVPARARTSRLASHPELQTVTMAEACAGAPTRVAAVDLPRLVDQRRLLHLDRPPGRSPGLEPAGRRAAGARRRRRLGAAGGAGPGARGDADRRRQRLVLVVRRRPLLRARPRVRRAVPPARAQRLPGAGQAGPRGAVRHQYHDGAAGRRASSRRPASFIRPSTARRPATSSGSAPAAWTPSETAGAMHQVADRTAIVSVVEFGVRPRASLHPGRRHRTDAAAARVRASSVRIKFLKPAGVQVVVRGGPGRRSRRAWRSAWRTAAGGGANARDCWRRQPRSSSCRSRLPCLGVETHDAVAFLVAVNRGGAEVEHHPRHRADRARGAGPAVSRAELDRLNAELSRIWLT